MIKTKRIGKVTWLDLQDPEEKDFKLLKEKYRFHHLDLDDCRSLWQRPKVEVYKSYKFAVLQIPMTSAGVKRVSMKEVDVFWSNSYLVTVHLGDNPIIKELMKRISQDGSKEKLLPFTGKKLFFMLCNNLIKQIFPLLTKYRSEIDRIDKDMFMPNSKEIVEDINDIRRELIISQTNIRQLVPVFTTLEKENIKIKDDIAEYWGEILDKLNKIKDEYEDFQEIVEGLNDSLESLLNHRTNEIIKTLTLFSVIMLPLTFITGFYGMNLDSLPFARTHEALFIISIMMVFISISMVIYFKIKKWF